MTYTATFGAWLKQRRLERGLTQLELANLISCATITIQKLERGERRPSRPMVLRLAEQFGVPAEARESLVILARQDTAALPELPSPLPREPLAGQPLTPLIGREQEVTDIYMVLRQPEVRLLTLSGPPGVGKTRLAQELGVLLQDEFAQGVAFVSLVPLHDPALVVPTIAHALGLHQKSNDDPLQQLNQALRDQQRLLILDNLEHVLACVPQLVALLEACPLLRILATSRERLRARAEYLVTVAPLALPAAQAPAPELAQNPAVALFLHVARRVQPQASFSSAQLALVAAICQRLDGLPLAIELVAPMLRLYGLEEVLALLEQRLVMSLVGARDLPSHLQRLHDAIGWSYDLLNDDERQMFESLGVFAGSWTARAAAALLGDQPDMGRTTMLLESLFDKSLVQRQTGTGAETRFVLLETIRDVALEQLRASGCEAEVRRRHAVFFLALVEEAAPNLYEPNRDLWIERVGREYANVRGALTWTMEHDGTLALRLVGELRFFWRLTGYMREGHGWMAQALIHLNEEVPPLVQARALQAAGNMAYDRGDNTLAHSYFTRSLATFRALDNQLGAANILLLLGATHKRMGDYEQTRDLYEEAIAVFRTAGKASRLATALMDLACVVDDMGDYGQARQLYAESMSLSQAIGDVNRYTLCLTNLGLLALHEGQYAKADRLFYKGLPWFQANRDYQNVAIVHINLGQSGLCQKLVLEAQGHFLAALNIARTEQQQFAAAYALEGLAGVAAALGHSPRAVRFAAAAHQLRQVTQSVLPDF
ncbi:MAG: tetratricopeptide repeat protein, partial [Chloroflexaceae bacterium]|nr:tetratricopeptide repeat protein [Chloroflexaceae bacterium]